MLMAQLNHINDRLNNLHHSQEIARAEAEAKKKVEEEAAEYISNIAKEPTIKTYRNYNATAEPLPERTYSEVTFDISTPENILDKLNLHY